MSWMTKVNRYETHIVSYRNCLAAVYPSGAVERLGPLKWKVTKTKSGHAGAVGQATANTKPCPELRCQTSRDRARGDQLPNGNNAIGNRFFR
jgi:hypothetical protein